MSDYSSRSYRVLPVYTGDVSGACSALYELGGMVVIHDPSGCNSTYNTHDETRWYDRDSLIFLSGLTERDAILGNDDKLVRDVIDAARELRPRFIALCNSPIPFLNGTDFAALTRVIEHETGIPCFYVKTNGMHDYTVGAGNALEQIAERFVRPAAKSSGTLNLLGVTPLDLGVAGSAGSLRSFAEEAGFSVVSCWAMGDGLDALENAARAEVNLVVSSVGLRAAELLYARFGTPFVAGAPIGAFRGALAQALRTAAKTEKPAYPCRDARTPAPDSTICAIGEPVIMGSLAAALEQERGMPVRVLCPLETKKDLLTPGDLAVEGEEGAENAAAGAELLIGDPLYAPVCGPCVLPRCRIRHFPAEAAGKRRSISFQRTLQRCCAFETSRGGHHEKQKHAETDIFRCLSCACAGSPVPDGSDTGDRKSAQPDAYPGVSVRVSLRMAVGAGSRLYRAASAIPAVWNAGNFPRRVRHGI